MLTAIDVSIGLALIYLILSLLCTSVQEAIAAMLQLRAKTLHSAVVELLEGALRPRFMDLAPVLIITPVYWYQSPSPLKLMMDRLGCADGGNPDPASTSGKDAAKAKEIELAGWPYPKHLAGRAYGLVVHGDVAGIEGLRRSLSDWLDWMGLIDAGFEARLDRYIGYYEPYATSHDTLDRDEPVQEEVRNVARALVQAMGEVRSGRLSAPADISRPRPK